MPGPGVIVREDPGSPASLDEAFGRFLDVLVEEDAGQRALAAAVELRRDVDTLMMAVAGAQMAVIDLLDREVIDLREHGATGV